ncbi:MAG: hypothetical protein C4522_07970 [Desulfobacteraceae bacterium]|nr:MAG: hypothetical protein C4522_07970 [Desulfobacteraceae bacterium]
MEKREPGKNTKDSAMDEDEIIELNELAESSDDEEILELTDPVDEDGVIELTDTIDIPEPDDGIVELTDTADDEIIELTDPAEALSQDSADISDEDELIELTDISGEEEIHDDEPIDLMETLESEAILIEVEPDRTVDPDETEKTLDLDDQDLLDLEADLLEPDEEIDIPAEDQADFDYELDNEFSESLGSDLGTVLTVSEKSGRDEPEAAGKTDQPGVVKVQVSDNRKKGAPIDFKFESKLHPGDKIIRESSECLGKDRITKEQVEMTIEKVVREMLSEKIDLLLTEMIEKAVSSEIQKIKKALLEDIEVQDE